MLLQAHTSHLMWSIDPASLSKLLANSVSPSPRLPHGLLGPQHVDDIQHHEVSILSKRDVATRPQVPSSRALKCPEVPSFIWKKSAQRKAE